MRINFDWQNFGKSGQEKLPTDRAGTFPIKMQEQNRISNQTILDISGKVTDDFSVGDHGGLAENLTKAMSSENYVAVQRDLMTVMSNSMSGEDFRKMQEEGFDPAKFEPAAAVTILDKIKTVLAQSGTTVTGYNDDLSVELMTEVTGSSGYARQIAGELVKADAPVTEENIRQIEEVVEQAETLQQPEESTKAYLLSRGMEPTLSNLYKAEHSGVGRKVSNHPTGYTSTGYSRQGTNTGWNRKTETTEQDYTQITGQIQLKIEEAGLPVNAETMADGQWLFEKGLPVTVENLQGLQELEQLSFPLDIKNVIQQAAIAIGEGRSPFTITLGGEKKSIYEEAAELKEQFEQISEEDISGEALKARKLLEEVRLKMTVEANVKLLRSGFSIDTAPMEELIQKLDDAVKVWEKDLFGTQQSSEKAALYTDTLQQIKELPGLPMATVGQAAFRERITVSEIVATGRNLQAQYQQAGESYEAIMTAPRADLGDNIRKAFRNTDAILEDMGMEINEANQRAVRIAGYNRMEISEENLTAIKEADAKIRNVITAMKPGAVLEMIREGRNPLNMSLEEVTEYFISKENDFVKDTEKYSEFLYKLDKTGGITEEEREAYIGIYRLLRQVEKSDGAVIGSLVAQNAELNFSNLLSSVRSRKFKHTDIRVDDSVGFLNDLNVKGISISDQIKRIEEILSDEKLQREYAGVQAKELRDFTAEITDEQTYLEQFKQPVTIEAMQSASVLRGKRGYTFGETVKLEEASGSEKAEERILAKAARFVEELSSEETRETAYEAMMDSANQVLEEALQQSKVSYVDLKEIQSLYKQLHLAADLSREENFEIPVQLGEEVTSINLTVIRNSADRGNVKITLETKKLGKVEARFTELPDGLEGSVLTDYMDGKETLEQQSDKLTQAIEEALQETETKVKSLFFGTNERLDINTVKKEKGENGGEISMLYKVAKEFIRYIQGIE